MTKAKGTGNLFPETVRSAFFRITGSRYDAMLERVKRKGFPGLPFEKEGLRLHILNAMGGNYDGFFRCRYCNGYFSIGEIAIDHAIPLSRRGGLELSNLDFPCSPCNNRKGGMTPTEYVLFTQFLDSALPLAKQDILSRLEKSIKLAAGARSSAGVIDDLRKSGEWQKAQKLRREAKKFFK